MEKKEPKDKRDNKDRRNSRERGRETISRWNPKEKRSESFKGDGSNSSQNDKKLPAKDEKSFNDRKHKDSRKKFV